MTDLQNSAVSRGVRGPRGTRSLEVRRIFEDLWEMNERREGSVKIFFIISTMILKNTVLNGDVLHMHTLQGRHSEPKMGSKEAERSIFSRLLPKVRLADYIVIITM